MSTLARVAALKYVDLPTFGFPTKPMRIPSRLGDSLNQVSLGTRCVKTH